MGARAEVARRVEDGPGQPSPSFSPARFIVRVAMDL